MNAFHRSALVGVPAPMPVFIGALRLTPTRARWLRELQHGAKSWRDLVVEGDARSASIRIWQPMLTAGLIVIDRRVMGVPVFAMTDAGRAALAALGE